MVRYIPIRMATPDTANIRFVFFIIDPFSFILRVILLSYKGIYKRSRRKFFFYFKGVQVLWQI